MMYSKGSGWESNDWQNATPGAHLAMTPFPKEKLNVMDKYCSILEKHGIKPNSNRIAVIQELLETEKAFSFCSLSKVLKTKMDRTTVYRILLLFTEKKLLQKIPCSDGNTLFVLNSNDASSSTNFRCKCCQKVENLPELPDEYLKLLSRQQINIEAIALEGYCKECNETHT